MVLKSVQDPPEIGKLNACLRLRRRGLVIEVDLGWFGLCWRHHGGSLDSLVLCVNLERF